MKQSFTFSHCLETKRRIKKASAKTACLRGRPEYALFSGAASYSVKDGEEAAERSAVRGLRRISIKESPPATQEVNASDSGDEERLNDHQYLFRQKAGKKHSKAESQSAYAENTTERLCFHLKFPPVLPFFYSIFAFSPKSHKFPFFLSFCHR